jgi:hypothetical protein
MDAEGIEGDLLVVHGDLFREQKFHHTYLFIGDDLIEIATQFGSTDELHFKPRVLLATAGSANAGLDCPKVRYIIRDGFPTSVQDFVQEMGRAGRWSGASQETDKYFLVVSIKSFYSILFRIFILPTLEKERALLKTELAKVVQDASDRLLSFQDNPNSSSTHTGTDTTTTATLPAANEDRNDELHGSAFLRRVVLSESELQKRQYKNFIEVIQLICLHPGMCIHEKLEKILVNPFQASNDNPSDDSDDGMSVPSSGASDSSDPAPLTQNFNDIVLGTDCCHDSCWECNGSTTSDMLSLPIRRKYLAQSLVDIFVNRHPSINDLKLTSNGLAKTFEKFVDHKGRPFCAIVFPGHRSGDAASAACRALVLKLFACGVLIPGIEGTHLFAKLKMSSRAIPFVWHKKAFDGFTFFSDKIIAERQRSRRQNNTQ